MYNTQLHMYIYMYIHVVQFMVMHCGIQTLALLSGLHLFGGWSLGMGISSHSAKQWHHGL